MPLFLPKYDDRSYRLVQQQISNLDLPYRSSRCSSKCITHVGVQVGHSFLVGEVTHMLSGSVSLKRCAVHKNKQRKISYSHAKRKSKTCGGINTYIIFDSDARTHAPRSTGAVSLSRTRLRSRTSSRPHAFDNSKEIQIRTKKARAVLCALYPSLARLATLATTTLPTRLLPAPPTHTFQRRVSHNPSTSKGASEGFSLSSAPTARAPR